MALYEFLNGQAALRWRLDDLPLIRLEDGSHLPPQRNGQPQAFLPGTITTGFPTVRASVCTTNTAREFLRSLGLTEPDPVDDVVRNVLPKYAREEIDIDDAQYEADIRRILTAFATDSKARQEKLIAALGDTTFVMAVDAGDGSECISRPSDVYLATERLKDLFAGVKGVLLVDDDYSCLRGEEVRKLLEACGAVRYLQPVPVATKFSWEERRAMRVAAGCADCTSEEPVQDQTLRGLDQLLSNIPSLDAEARVKRMALLWDALGDVAERRGMSTFSGTYRWTYYYRRSTTFDAAFVAKLNAETWVPDGNGELQRPEFVLFDALGWKPNPYLQSKLRFKPPLVETLAREVGIEPGVLDLLKKHGVTSVAELVARLGLSEELKLGDGDSTSETKDETGEPKDAPVAGSSKTESDGTVKRGQRTESGDDSGPKDGPKKGTQTSEGKPTEFISYIGVHPDHEEPDPDGLDQQARMVLEEKAITLILRLEPNLRRTPTNNPGFDLFAEGEDGVPVKWVEVKAKTDTLRSRPVGLSRVQFDAARERGPDYWVYVVERADLPEEACVVRIQDPAGRARTFTFDHGWLQVAETTDVTRPT